MDLNKNVYNKDNKIIHNNDFSLKIDGFKKDVLYDIVNIEG